VIRFQFHLSTAVILSFVAGGLIWANLPHDVYARTDTAHEMPTHIQGWPKPFSTDNSVWILTSELPYRWSDVREFSWQVLVGDCAVAMMILAVVAITWERIVFRRKAP